MPKVTVIASTALSTMPRPGPQKRKAPRHPGALRAAMLLVTVLFLAYRCIAQEQNDTSKSGIPSLHFQQTMIIQNHDRFPSPYSGRNSLVSNEQPAMTLTTTLYFRAPLQDVGDAELDPEIAGGKGLSFSTGMAGFPNGEAYRVSEVAPRLEFVRAYLQMKSADRSISAR